MEGEGERGQSCNICAAEKETATSVKGLFLCEIYLECFVELTKTLGFLCNRWIRMKPVEDSSVLMAKFSAIYS